MSADTGHPRCTKCGIVLFACCGDSLCCQCVLSGEHPKLGWHVISGEFFLGALRRVADGEDSDLVYLELWANADHEVHE